MAIIQSIFSDQPQKTSTVSGRVIQPLISPSKPIVEKKVEVTPSKPVAEKKSLISKIKDSITGLDTKKIGEYFKAGVKATLPMFQQGAGVLVQNYVNSAKRQQQVFETALSKVQPKKVTEARAELIKKVNEPVYKKIEETGKTLKETGFQKQKSITEELTKKVTPSTGLQGFLEQAVFNLPQMMASTGLAVGVGIVTKNPVLASSVALSTSYSLSASEVYQEARTKGLTDEQAMPLATLGGIVIGALDFVPMERLIRKTGAVEPIKKAIIKRIADGIIDTAIQSGTEGVTEALQEIIGGAIAKTYDENRDVFEGVTTAGLIGMLFGGVSNVTVAGIMGIKGKGATNEEVVKEVETKVGDALEKSPEERTPEEQEVAKAVLTQTLTPDQAMNYVLENNLSNTEIGNKIIRAVAEAKTLNQNIKLSPTDDEKSLNIELIEPTQREIRPIKEEQEVVPGEKQPLETTTEGQVVEKEPITTPGEEKTAEVVGKPKTFYRGGGEGSMPVKGTAQDVINYETKELGNKDITIEPGIKLEEIPTANLVWLTETEKDAKEYGEVAEVRLKNYRIIARDSDGGVLVEIGKKPQITAKPVPSPTPKKVSKVEPKKTTPLPAKPKVSITGAVVREIPSIKIEKIHKAIVPKYPQIPILSYVHVKDGQMRMTNLEITASINTNTKDGMYQVIGSDLVPIDPKLAEDFPPLPKVEGEVAKILPENIVEGIKDAVIYASGDATRPVLTGLKFEFGKTRLRIVSTDGFRLFNKSYGIKSTKEASFIVSVPEKLNRILGDISKGGGVLSINYNEKEGLVSFTNDNGSVVVRTVQADFPEYTKIYPQINHKIVVDKKKLDQALKAIAPYASERANVMELRIEPTKLTLFANGEGETTKSVDIPITDSKQKDYSGVVEGQLLMPVKTAETKYLSVNYKFLQDSLKSLKENDVYLGYFVDEKGKTDLSTAVTISDIDEVPYIKSDILTENIKTEIKHQQASVEGVNVEKLVKLFGDEAKIRQIMKDFGIEELSPKEKKLRKYIRSGTQANIDRFTDIKSIADSEGYYKAIQFPEVVRMVREILGSVPSVKTPRYRPSLGGRPLGLFVGAEGVKEGKIVLNPEIFKSPEQAIKVFAHEVGHMADWLPDYTLKRGNIVGHIAVLNKYMKHTFGDLKLKEVKEELKAVTQMWKPFNEDEVSGTYLKYRYSPAELYADAISMLFNDPQLLKQTAPTFWQGFFEAIDQKDDFKKAFFETMDLLNKGEPTILSEREKNIREMFAKGEDLFKAKLLEKTQAENDIVFRLKHELIDRNQRVIDDVNKAVKANRFVADEDNPIYYLEENNYIGGKVKAWLERNVQPVYADLQANEVSWEDFGEVLFLERVINERGGTRNPIDFIRKSMPEVYDRIKNDLPEGIEGKTSDEQVKFLTEKFGEDITGGLPLGIANPLGYDVETAQKQLDYLKKQLGDKYKAIDRNLPVFRNAIKSLIPQAYEAQLYKKSVVEKIMANPAYATFQVLDYMDTFIPASIKQQVGTLKDVANPAGSTILKAISTIRAIEKNKAKIALVEFYKKNFPETMKPAKTIWTGRTHIPVESKDADLKLLTLMEDGTFKGYYTDPYIADTVMNMGTGRVNAVISVLKFMNSKLFRPLFITYNPGFQTFNLLRDFMRFYKNIPGMSLPRAVKRYAQALKPAIARAWDLPNELITEMEDKKILAVTYNDVVAGLTDEDKQVDFIMKRYGLQKDEQAKRALFKIPIAILDQIAKAGNFIETLPKVAGYVELNGKMPPKKVASFIRTSVGSPDFLRKGAGYSWYNEVFLFSNAIKEGMRADYNVAFKNPKTRGGWWLKTAGFTLLPKLLMYAGILGLFGGSMKKMFEDASEYDKTNYTIVPLGRDKNGRTVYLRIPQDETGRFIGGFFWKSLMLLKQKSLAFSDIAEIFSYTGGQVPGLTPSLTSTFAVAQFLAGQNPYDFFRGRNVIPDTEFKAGGSYALKPFAVWMLNQLGGGVFWKTYISQQSPETRTWTQKIIEAPVISNIVGRWIKVSDYGQKEMNREIINKTEQDQAKESLRRRELIDKYVELYKKDPSKKWEVERKLIEEILGHPAPKDSDEKTLRTNTLKKFEIGILRGESDANLTSLIDANTNAEKVAILKRLQTVMDQKAYDDLIRTAKEYKIISDEVVSGAKLQSSVQKAKSALAGLFKVKEALAYNEGGKLAFAGTPREEEVYNKMKSDWVSGEASYYNPKNPAETRPGGSGIGAYGRPIEEGSVAFGNRVFHEALKKGEVIYIKVRGFEDVKTPYGNGVFRIDDTMNVRYSQKGKFNVDFNASDLDKAKKSKGRFPIKFRIVEPGGSETPVKRPSKTAYA